MMGEYGAFGGMTIAMGTQSILRKHIQWHTVHHRSHMTWPGFESGPLQWKLAANNLSYDMAVFGSLILNGIIELK
jgi:hypothetical protein